MFVGLWQQLQPGHESLPPEAGLSGLDRREEIRNKTNEFSNFVVNGEDWSLEAKSQSSEDRGQNRRLRRGVKYMDL